MATDGVLGIAHAYGNRRSRIEAALTSGVPMIEVDLRWWRGELWVRHEHRLGWLPLLYNHRLRGIHREGPFAFSLAGLWLRLDFRRLRFRELLARTTGETGLLIDLKAGRYSRSVARGFVANVLTEIEDARFKGSIDFCGGWSLLDLVRSLKPNQPVHYSIDGPDDWARIQGRLALGAWPGGVTIQQGLLTAERGALLRAAGVDFYAWDVETLGEMETAVAAGAAGIIADDLDMLAKLRRGTAEGALAG